MCANNQRLIQMLLEDRMFDHHLSLMYSGMVHAEGEGHSFSRYDVIARHKLMT